MPTLLQGVLRYPVSYYPFFIRTATLISTPAAFTYLDMLFPNASGQFDRQVTTNAVLVGGYAFALEQQVNLASGQTVVQVVMPGSVIPMISDNTLTPGCLVIFVFAGGAQNVTIATAANLAAGLVIGRYIGSFVDTDNFRLSATSDIVLILSGAV